MQCSPPPGSAPDSVGGSARVLLCRLRSVLASQPHTVSLELLVPLPPCLPLLSFGQGKMESRRSPPPPRYRCVLFAFQTVTLPLIAENKLTIIGRVTNPFRDLELLSTSYPKSEFGRAR
ncbi:hypothetical protein Bca52824_005565 [Brassica carinata]|uniref:Uncharacterized protein n=1 Tax=Brassica carinata TaxID=52824 RepID=A0A8X7WS39_BRACI|nr:hypothetical protein Bca52824_005565 [Brassica carinata]